MNELKNKTYISEKSFEERNTLLRVVVLFKPSLSGFGPCRLCRPKPAVQLAPVERSTAMVQPQQWTALTGQVSLDSPDGGSGELQRQQTGAGIVIHPLAGHSPHKGRPTVATPVQHGFGMIPQCAVDEDMTE